MPEHALDTAVLACLQSRNLFYPSAGKDFLAPIEMFLSWVEHFWFVDINYGGEPLLAGKPEYHLLDLRSEPVTGLTIKKKEPFEVRMFHEIYERREDKRRFTLHQCKGFGYNAFRASLKCEGQALSIFFYRGDSGGDGGSNFLWLQEDRLKNVLEVLEDGGLIVSDGSNAIRQLKRFHHSELGISAVDQAEAFVFGGKSFECLGYAGERYGPTLVWQVLNGPQCSEPAADP
jgi:hypothetical protein